VKFANGFPTRYGIFEKNVLVEDIEKEQNIKDHTQKEPNR
jgi:hypothetical protein